jgi:hypothetical protein
MNARLVLVVLVAAACTAVISVVASAGAEPRAAAKPAKGAYEVWLIDQEDRFNAGAGTLHVFDGRELARDASAAVGETIDLGQGVASLCQERTGSVPLRPHMLVFNGGDEDGGEGNRYAIVAFVASGHVAFLDADTREAVDCIDVGTQAHAAWPTPDGRQLIVANQNGKKLQRIATDYDSGTFRLEDDATLDLAACTTPSGAPCEDPELRPDNAPICPRVTSEGLFTFVTLRGGGMFIVDHRRTPMRIVAEYDRSAVDDNGCGEMEARDKMYVNSGAGLTVPPVPGDDPYGHDVYAVDLDELTTTPRTTPNEPPARLVYERSTQGTSVDAHAVALTKRGRYLWWGDRGENDVTVVNPRNDRVVGRFTLAGELSDDPAPDLFDGDPRGRYVFASLRGPNPSSGHEAFGSTPGVGVIRVTRDGRAGRLVGVARVGSVRGTPDPHAIRVRPLR